jgi:hypothetical protein
MKTGDSGRKCMTLQADEEEIPDGESAIGNYG